MVTTAAPRIDERIRRYIIGSTFLDTPAGTTRAAGALAWELGLARPSYEQVRELMRAHRLGLRRRSVRAFLGLVVRVARVLRHRGRLCNRLLRTAVRPRTSAPP